MLLAGISAHLHPFSIGSLGNPLEATSSPANEPVRDLQSSNYRLTRANSCPLGWKAENAQLIAPLTPKVRSGLMSPLTEERLTVNRKTMTLFT